MRIIFAVFSILVTLQLAAKDSDYYKNVRTGRSGDVFINGIPQVNQKRNYCVPACVSMIVRYYDSKINQKKLARLFSTSSKTGTLSSEIEDAFFNEPVLQEFELKKLYTLTEQDYASLMQFYESSAKNKHKKKRNTKDENSNVFDNLNPEVARRVFPSARPHLGALLQSICRTYIASGVPVMWAVAMNLDPAVSMKGGHMRIIVGFNEQNNKLKKILYRDPWGGVTKIKRVDFDDASTMTLELYAIIPKGYTPGYSDYKSKTVRNYGNVKPVIPGKIPSGPKKSASKIIHKGKI